MIASPLGATCFFTAFQINIHLQAAPKELVSFYTDRSYRQVAPAELRCELRRPKSFNQFAARLSFH
jgi:hypothetical protein